MSGLGYKTSSSCAIFLSCLSYLFPGFLKKCCTQPYMCVLSSKILILSLHGRDDLRACYMQPSDPETRLDWFYVPRLRHLNRKRGGGWLCAVVLDQNRRETTECVEKKTEMLLRLCHVLWKSALPTIVDSKTITMAHDGLSVSVSSILPSKSKVESE